MYKNICIQMFIAAAFITAETWKQPSCLSIGEWIKCGTSKQWNIVQQWKEIRSHEKTWRKLKCILLSERSQSEKATYCMIPTIWHSEKGKNHGDNKRSLVAKGSGGGREGRQEKRRKTQWKKGAIDTQKGKKEWRERGGKEGRKGRGRKGWKMEGKEDEWEEK